MQNSIKKIAIPSNEPILGYLPNSKEKLALKEELKRRKNTIYDIPQYINGREIRTNNTIDIFPPHELNHKIGHYHVGDNIHVHLAIESALNEMENTNFETRSAIFLKYNSDQKYRASINAATILGQSKNLYQRNRCSL